MPKILQLSPQMANLIAAGEVVERPASVAKELIENSIDAGAKQITVELQNGGMTLLRVADDGCGIAAEDAPTAFLRHATSKLRTKEDLAAIGTLGFRGEALAATAAVSRVDLLTRTEEAPLGVHLRLEGGRLLEQEEAGCPVGTTVIVRDLFFNTPARMKFMKRDSVEASAVVSAVQKQALAHPEISFRVIKDGQTQLHTPGDGDLRAAIYAVLGRQTAAELVEVHSSWESIALDGFVSRPTATRGTRNYQLFYVNRRHIKSRLLTAALEEAYRNQLMAGRFPLCVLNLTIPNASVDVNVHPAKTEVKFLREKDVFDALHYGVLGALNQTPAQVEMKLPERKPLPPVSGKPYAPPREKQAAPKPKQDFYRTMTAEEYRAFTGLLEALPKVEPSEAAVEQLLAPLPLRETVEPLQLPCRDGYQPSASPAQPKDPCRDGAQPSASPAQPKDPCRDGYQPSASPTQPEFSCRDGSQPSASPAQPEFSCRDGSQPSAPVQEEMPLPTQDFRVVGEVLQTYVVVEQGDEVVFIDKHAAHERIGFERLKQQGVQVMGQLLLAPEPCALDREEAALLAQNRELLLSLGYDLDSLGDGTLLLRQIPADVELPDAVSCLSEIAGHLQNGRLDTPEALRDEALHSIACKAAIKAGSVTSPLERERLAREVLSRGDLKYCPHGRPICVILSRRQLEKQFKRT